MGTRQSARERVEGWLWLGPGQLKAGEPHREDTKGLPSSTEPSSKDQGGGKRKRAQMLPAGPGGHSSLKVQVLKSVDGVMVPRSYTLAAPPGELVWIPEPGILGRCGTLLEFQSQQAKPGDPSE